MQTRGVGAVPLDQEWRCAPCAAAATSRRAPAPPGPGPPPEAAPSIRKAVPLDGVLPLRHCLLLLRPRQATDLPYEDVGPIAPAQSRKRGHPTALRESLPHKMQKALHVRLRLEGIQYLAMVLAVLIPLQTQGLFEPACHPLLRSPELQHINDADERGPLLCLHAPMSATSRGPRAPLRQGVQRPLRNAHVTHVQASQAAACAAGGQADQERVVHEAGPPAEGLGQSVEVGTHRQPHGRALLQKELHVPCQLFEQILPLGQSLGDQLPIPSQKVEVHKFGTILSLGAAVCTALEVKPLQALQSLLRHIGKHASHDHKVGVCVDEACQAWPGISVGSQKAG
mmetsp:Transcript_58089/g.118075  ORF Transcript_58089/g.118075 Transcript_58089/m.118075 type:complete len:340 (-) Transcript_58089:418-1437(-)